jgi:hypothetical protein
MRLHCNRADCQATFEADGVTHQRFAGATATRTNEMVRCPVCGRVDSQWVYAANVMPAFTGGFDARKRAAREWRNSH